MDEFEITKELKKRFYLMKTQGNQNYFLDIKTGTKDLGVSHIRGVLAHDGHPWDLIKKVTDGLNFKLSSVTQEMVYQPLSKEIVQIEGLLFQNRWKPPRIRPSSGNCDLFEAHLLLAMGDQAKVDYLLDLLAFRYQSPNAMKPHAVVYIYQAQGGNGKSLLATTLSQVFGETAVQIASESKMNSGSKVQLWQTTLLIAEEANVTRGGDIYDTIKTYSGASEIFDDSKHAHFKAYKIPATLLMLSNRPPNFLEPHDRRFFVSEWKIDLERDEKAAYFQKYINWLENGGYEAIAGLLSRRLITRDMYAPVPVTDEKMSAMSIGHDSCVREILDILEDAQEARIFKSNDFEEIFEKHGLKSTQIKHKMVEAGLKEHDQRLVIGNSRYRPWHRKEDTIVSVPGRGTLIEFGGIKRSLESTLFSPSNRHYL